MSYLLLGASLLSTALGAVTYGGANIAGFDFGCSTDGTCTVSGVQGPITSANDGPGQMAHFASADNMNIFRLPVGWQYLVNNEVGGDLDAANLASYDSLVQSCLATGAHCIIDIHNYARWNGQVIGQGGPTNAQFASLWSQLATKYATESNIIFGIMNEPHDVSNINTWADTVQAAVTAIRQAGATSQTCLLPGTDYASAASFVANSASALMGVSNPDGSTTNLVFDVHKYLDSDGSGTNAACASDQISNSFSPLADYLRTNNRMAMLSETGGGPTDASCLTNLCAAIDFLNDNSDVYLGYVGWAAGSFATSYVTSMTPTGSNSTGWTDQELVTRCMRRNATSSATSSSSSSSESAAPVVASSSSAAVVSSSAAAAVVPTSAASTMITSTVPSSTALSSASVAPTTLATSVLAPSSSSILAPTSSVALAVAPTATSAAAEPEPTDDDDTCEP